MKHTKGFLALTIFISIVSGIFFLVITGQTIARETAPNLSPEGYWKTIDDKTSEVKSIVKIWITNDGTLKGRIEKIFPKPGENPNPKCHKCQGDKKNQPMLGMEFMWGFKGTGTQWKNGKILDPEQGKVYHCQLEMLENGQKLNVFGYIRIIFKVGRSQTWHRTEKI